MKAVISGATRGIGRGIAEKLAVQGYDLVLIARTESDLRSLKSSLEDNGITVSYLACDLAKNESIQSLKSNANLFEGVTLTVNNLGIYSMQNAKNIDLEGLQKQVEVNLYSAIRLTQFVLKDFSSSIRNIVNIASVMSIKSQPFAADYSISKHAFKAWNDALREELRSAGIKVSVIYPGSVNTSSWDGLEVDRNAMIQAEDIAECVQCILKMSDNALLEEVHVSSQTFVP